jgi:hypothetical protein
MQPPVPSEIDGFTKDGFPRTSMPLVLGDGPEMVNHGDDRGPDKERGMSMGCGFCDNFFKCHIGSLTIDILSDDVLLHMFNLYPRASNYWPPLDASVPQDTWPWRELAHVCQRWRRIIFAWHNQLGVQVECISGTGIAKVLDVWPTLPLSISLNLDDKIPDGDDLISGL